MNESRICYQPIETARKDGSEVLCWRAGWDHPIWLCWKINSRLPGNRGYFGDPHEMDDYDFADSENQPTHHLPVETIPLPE